MTDTPEKAREILQRHTARGYTAGMVGLIGEGDEREILTAGVQALGGPPMARGSLFRIASMTKPVTAVAALMLVEDGRLTLDEPVDRLLPELANRRVLRAIDAELDDTTPARRPITVEDLLTFRLGTGLVLAPPGAYPIQRAISELGLMGFGPPDPLSPLAPDEWIARLGTLPLMAQPGEEWMYTAGSNVLGVLIARAAGQSLPDFFEARIFGPLGMGDTAFFAPPAKIDRLTTAYRSSENGLQLYDDPRIGGYAAPPTFPAGDGGLVSTIDDFFAFSRFIARGGRVGDGQLLSPATIAAMTRNQVPADKRGPGQVILGPGRGWGYGLAVVTDDAETGFPAGVYGWNGGLGTSWLVDPASDRTAILLTQTLFERAEPPAAHDEFQRLVLGPT